VIDVVTFGEAMAVLRGDGPLRVGPSMQLSVAGAESNVAIGLARLGHAARWAGRVGDDELGALVLRTLRAEGVDTIWTCVDPERPTGLMLREHRVGDIVRVQYYRSGSAGGAITTDDVLPALDEGARVLHVTGVTPALGDAAAECVRAAIDRAGEIGALVSLDVNYRARLWPAAAARDQLRRLLRGVNVLFASEHELPLVAAGPAELLDEGVREVVVKRGAAGASSYTAEGVTTAAAKAIRVVDVVGAGDAFAAGYLSALLDGGGVAARLERAVITGAFAVAHHGDWEGSPNRAELHLLDAAEGTTIR
jgi:2-dehydro-3-deoxygluconokinase